MPVWLVRAGKHGEQEDAAIRHNIAAIGWNELPDLSRIQDREALIKLYTSVHFGTSRHVAVGVGQVWTFWSRILEGDLVITPLKKRGAIAIGVVTGKYEYRPDLKKEGVLHTRPVRWLRTDFDREDFDEDILHSIGAFMTVCRIQRNNAEERIRRMISDIESL